jgi:hypothetical protein
METMHETCQKMEYSDNDYLKSISILDEIIPDEADKCLDQMFYAWLGGEGASDDLSSPKERELIGYYYRKFKELLTSLPE